MRFIRGLYYSIRFKNIEFPFRIRKGLKYHNLKYAKIGKGTGIDDHAEIHIQPLYGNSFPIVDIGKNVWIGRYNIIASMNKITIEDNVLFGPFVYMIDANHNYDDIEKPINRQGGSSPGPIHIKRDTWIGAYVKILGGVTIGKHCVIAAGSLVNKDIPDYSIAAGTPAEVIKQYNFNSQKWEKVQ